MFQELYFYRWPVELKYKELKSKLAIEEFSGATTTSVFQEFYINMLLSNLSSLIKNQANRAFIIGFMKRLLPKYCVPSVLSTKLTDFIQKLSVTGLK